MSIKFDLYTRFNKIKLRSIFVIIIFTLLLITFNHQNVLASEIWEKYTSNPIIQPGSEGEWDEYFIYPGSVIKENDKYKMWYTGANKTGLQQIGFAESTDGKSWTKYSDNPILKVGNNGQWDDTIAAQASVIYSDGKYQMWYSGNSDVVTNEHWRIGYATSSDGLDWTKYPENPVLNAGENKSWDDKAVYQPSVLKINSIYFMWYSATSYNANEPRWKLGFATSLNGYTWTKNSNNPVMIVDNQWEYFAGDGIGGPFVIFEDKKFHLWYHTSGIGYAQSPDGINWTKYINNPILKKGSAEEWDRQLIVLPKIIKDKSKYLMWYGGQPNLYSFKIGLAEATQLPEILPPPPPPESPIVIIPGLGASWNQEDFLSCSLTNSGNWAKAPGIKVYDSLTNSLANQGLKEGEDFQVYYYDWRQPLEIQVDKFKNYLENLLTNYENGSKARLIGHSLGGLLIRGFLEKYPNSGKIYKAMTVGTPHKGSLYAYPLWEAGINWIDDISIKTRIALLLNFCRFKISPSPTNPAFNQFVQITVPANMFKSQREIVQSIAPIIKTLLPVFNYLKFKDMEINSSTLIHQNDWVLLHPFPTPVYRELTLTLSGTGQQTLRYINIAKPKNNKNGNWADGKPKSKENIKEGDNTVLNLSSKIDGINNIVIDGGHNQIIASEEGIGKIFEFLGIEVAAKIEMVAFPEEKAQTALSIISDGEVSMTLKDPEQKSYQSEENVLINYDPKAGNYDLILKSNKDNEVLLNINYIDKSEDENTFSYKVKLQKNKERKLRLKLTPRSAKKIQLSAG